MKYLPLVSVSVLKAEEEKRHGYGEPTEKKNLIPFTRGINGPNFDILNRERCDDTGF